MSDAHAMRARKAIASALKSSLDVVGPAASVDTLPEWDSIGHVNLILELETELGRTLSPEEIAGISSVEDVARLYEHGPATA